MKEQTDSQNSAPLCEAAGCYMPARWKRRTYSPESATHLCEEHWQELLSRSTMSAGLYEKLP